MPGPFIHRIDPVFGEIAGLYLWWYGLSYTIGFLGIHLWFRRVRGQITFSLVEVYDFSIYLIVGVLIGGRLVEVLFYEWTYYKNHLFYIPAYWLGGMSSHGLLLGAAVSTWIFCHLRGRNFLTIADELVIPGAWVMGIGRIGNFIDGQILGATANVWWAVKFPDAAGFRHPVVLYDGLKNLFLIPLLLMIRRSKPAPGVVFAHFLWWYAFLRLFLDVFREYRVSIFEIGTGQIINLLMSLAGLLLMVYYSKRKHPRGRVRVGVVGPPCSPSQLWLRRAILAFLILFCLVIPSDWTQDVPARYGKRHPGLEYSVIYPRMTSQPAPSR